MHNTKSRKNHLASPSWARQVAVAVLVLLELLYTLSFPASLSAAFAPDAQEIIPLPDEASVAGVFIEAYNHPFGLPDMRSDKLDGEACKEVFEAFSRFGKMSRSPAPHERLLEMGSVRFVGKKYGESTRVCWYFRGDKSTLRLSISGVRVRTTERTVEGEETLALDSDIRKILKKRM
ncbi:MAG: hypothetical protein U0939_22920 [Pirellulales bacterium]